MLQSTHQRIAMHLVDSWDDSMREICSVDDFVYGSILPDRTLPLRLMTHGFPQSGAYVFRLLADLIHKSLTPKQFGRKLGIVAHFLADYACSYHSNPRLKNRILGHRAYEGRIDSLPLQDPSEDLKATNLSSLWSELEQYVERRHGKQSLEDPTRDLADARFWVSHVVGLVFETVFAKEPSYDQQRVALFADTYYPHVNGVSNTIRRYSLHMTQEGIEHLLIVPSCKKRNEAMEKGIPLQRIKSLSFPFYKGAMVAIPNKRRLHAVLDLLRPTG